MVEFDGRGIVKRFNECGDRELLKVLPDYLKVQPDRPLFAEPMERTIRAGTLVIEKDALALNGERISRSSILGMNDLTIPERTLLHIPPKPSKGPDPLQIEVGLRLN